VVFAVSDVIAPGEHLDLRIDAKIPFVSGTIYTATLYYDNGDGMFTLGEDTPAVDDTGTAVSLPVAIP
jgi:hypothetical protein